MVQTCNYVTNLNSADKVSSTQGESHCTQATIQHNRGGPMYIVQGNHQPNQSPCNSICSTVSAVDHQITDDSPSYHNANLKYTNWCQFYPETSNYVHIVYLTTNGQLVGDFYYIMSDTIFGPGQLFHCEAFPGEYLQIIHVQNMMVHLPLRIQERTYLEQMNAKIVAHNFKQDYNIFNWLGMSYEKYMDMIIMNLIEKQDKTPNCTMDKVSPRDNGVVSNIVDSVDMHEKNDQFSPHANPHPQFFENFDDHRNTQHLVDFNDPDKDKGFLSLQETTFQFIGPDRDFCNYYTVEQVTRIADIIRDTGLPNYKQARFSIKSDLNLPAWEKYLADYPDQRIIQYLKFGFPLSLTNPDHIHDTHISNHFSALQHPQAIQQYLDKEKSHGAILGPFSEVPSDNFHCSPMLTRPKDVDKRRVILNLSYPKGKSLNDHVDKHNFDGKKLF